MGRTLRQSVNGTLTEKQLWELLNQRPAWSGTVAPEDREQQEADRRALCREALDLLDADPDAVAVEIADGEIVAALTGGADAGTDEPEADEVIEVDGLRVVCPGDETERAEAIIAAADDEGTIQAEEMVAIFPGQPRRHTTCSMTTALAWIGARVVD